MRAVGLTVAQGSGARCFEVLHNGGEMKFIACARKPPEAHPLETVVCLQVCEAHLNTLSFVSCDWQTPFVFISRHHDTLVVNKAIGPVTRLQQRSI